MNSRIGFLVYGIAAYAIFFATFLYAIGFVGNVMVPKSIDSPPTDSFLKALLINLSLLSIFAAQHSIMARKRFKAWWTKKIPEPIERSTYVLLSSIALLLLFWQWRPMGGVVWDIQDSFGRMVMTMFFALGWTIVLISTFLIDHSDLFGLRQVWLHYNGKKYTPLRFRTPGLYQHVRHPLYLGWFFAFWATPKMTAAHFVFAMATAAYILLAIQFEERDLRAAYGQAYEKYQSKVPMLLPRLTRWRRRRGGIDRAA